MPGGFSNFCSHPIRGLEGGEMRNSLSGSGGRRNFSDVPPRKTIGYKESGECAVERDRLLTYAGKVDSDGLPVKGIFVKTQLGLGSSQ